MSRNDDAQADRLQRLRNWRDPDGPDRSMKFVGDWFKHTYAKPHEQVAQFVELWEMHIPPHLFAKTALASFNRGVLTVHVADSAAMYELDRLMRGGLERQIKSAAKASLRKIRLRVANLGD